MYKSSREKAAVAQKASAQTHICGSFSSILVDKLRCLHACPMSTNQLKSD